MKLLKIYFLIIVLYSCQSKSIIQRTETIYLQKFDPKKTINFDNKTALFSIDLVDLKSYAVAIKNSDSIKYKFSKNEIDFLVSLDDESTNSTDQYLFSNNTKSDLDPIIIKDSIFKTLITEEFLQKKIIEGETSIYHKRTFQNIESIVISRPRVSHFETFQVFSNDDLHILLFERNLLVSPK